MPLLLPPQALPQAAAGATTTETAASAAATAATHVASAAPDAVTTVTTVATATVSAANAIDHAAHYLLTTLAVLLTVAIFFTGISAGARRLLGIRIGFLRTLIACAAGMTAFQLFNQSLHDTDSRAALFTVSLTVSLLAAMAVLVLVEILVPSGSWPRPVQWARAVRGRLTRARRYSQISRIFMRHGLGRYVRGRAGLDRAAVADEAGREAARSLRLALEECGGTFIKLGQVLSTRRDVLPPHIVEELSRLQSDVPPAPWSEVEAVLREELRAPLADVFADFDHEPLAAASIAQVHRATLRDGSTVVVKVQRPGIRESVERDLDIVLAMAQGLHVRARSVQGLGLRDLADGFAIAVREELDFRIEARNADAVAAAGDGRAQDAPVRVPAVHHELSSARVMVQEWLDGVTLERAGADADARGLDRDALARTVLGAMLRQIMRDGVFHADPHPGNILLLAADGKRHGDDDQYGDGHYGDGHYGGGQYGDGQYGDGQYGDGQAPRIGLLDFGSVGRIDATVRDAIQYLLLAVDRGDPAGMCDAVLELLGPRPDGRGAGAGVGAGDGDAADDGPALDALLLERELGRFMARHLGPSSRPDAQTFTALFRLLTRFGLTVPPEVAAVFRALATLEGTLTRISPRFDLVAEARREATALVTERLAAAPAARLASRATRTYATWTGTPYADEAYEDPAWNAQPLDGAALTRAVAQELLPLLPMLRRMPRRAERITTSLEQGRLTARVRLLADDRDRRFIAGLVHQLLVTLLAAGTGLMAVFLLALGTGRGPHVTSNLELFPLLGYNLLAVSAILTLRVIYAAIRRGP
ncbi:ABC1 kinase family protein [Streptomyces sp. 7N604]|uniref:ABC1 kinase family protein n=1 Tax=Streptomyces sp. 7N604 TaxID=3457415 RepID=UPI003FD55683